MLVRNDLVSEEIDMQLFQGGQLEVQGVKINTFRSHLSILNIYNPNKNILEPEFLYYFRQLGNEIVVIGDFNAHHTLWDPRVNRICNTGRNLINALSVFPLQLVTTESMPTYMDPRTGHSSTIDLCFVTANIFHATSIELGQDCGSDHCPIHVSIQTRPTIIKGKTRKKWKFPTDWRLYQEQLKASIENIQDDWRLWNSNDINQFLVTNIIQAGEQNFGMTTGEINTKYNKPYWNQDCDLATRARRRAKYRFNRNPCPANADSMRAAENLAKNVLINAKEEDARNFIDQIKSTTPIGQAWTKISKFKSTYKPKNSPLLINNNLVTNTEEKANLFADHFSSVYTENDDAPHNIKQQVKDKIDNAIRDPQDEYNSPYTIVELNLIINKLKGNPPALIMFTIL
jgi:hypothetical protein